MASEAQYLAFDPGSRVGAVPAPPGRSTPDGHMPESSRNSGVSETPCQEPYRTPFGQARATPSGGHARPPATPRQRIGIARLGSLMRTSDIGDTVVFD